MTDIQECDELKALIRPELLRLAFPSRQYTCLRCGRPGDTMEPTSAVGVAPAGGYPGVVMAHAPCLPSMVVYPASRPVLGVELAGMTVLKLGPAGERWPVMLLDRGDPAFHRTQFDPTGRPLNLLLLDPLKHGLARLPARDALPPATLGWRLELSGSRARLTAKDGTLIYYWGAANPPAGWPELAAERGGCAVITGTMGLAEGSVPAMSGWRLNRRLARAARLDWVAGGIVPVTR